MEDVAKECGFCTREHCVGSDAVDLLRQSPDLTVLDLYLWGHVKNSVSE